MEVKEANFVQYQKELLGKSSKSEMNFLWNTSAFCTAGVEADQQTSVSYITQGIPRVGGTLEPIKSFELWFPI